MKNATGHIMFIMLPEKGHLTPAFKIARTLQARGHRVSFAGTRELESLINPAEFEIARLFPNGFPPPPIQSERVDPNRRQEINSAAAAKNALESEAFFTRLLKQEIGTIVREVHPDLV